MRRTHLQIAGVLQHRLPGSRIRRRGLPNVSTANAESVPYDLDALRLGLAIGINLQFQRHAEQIKVLRNFAHYAEAFLHAIDGVLHLEFRRAGAIDPLREERSELLTMIFFRDRSKSATVADLPANFVMKSFIVLSNASSPITQRSMWKIMPPLSVPAPETAVRTYPACQCCPAALCHRPDAPTAISRDASSKACSSGGTLRNASRSRVRLHPPATSHLCWLDSRLRPTIGAQWHPPESGNCLFADVARRQSCDFRRPPHGHGIIRQIPQASARRRLIAGP